MTRKIFGPKSITHLIYGLLMMLPFLAIGVKCAYVAANKNAYMSYSSSQSPDTYLSNDTITSLDVNKIYQFTTSEDLIINNNYNTINVKEIVMIKFTSGYTGYNKIASYFHYYKTVNGSFIHIHYVDNTNDYIPFANSSDVVNGLVQFNFVSSNNINNYVYTINTKMVVFGKQQSLDNVFDYSISQVIDENNGFVPKNDFVSLLNGVFSTNSNHLYLRFTNWYLNYALLISTIYILFLAMLWFVNLCRNILERSMNIGNGVDY